ncbi:FkbM family methyltransferase [Microvirga splendida]|uniref:FkbM family methyltransferase n=1 Tax=Microvirga splendida TaxID=2795727 RepID=A0ABS0XXG8_9HYPH|nr:FkbM family methyltransferase [Microvirga splendida]MBJ6124729.1 FkbM family methyltransferase [Microvirga splendida]
MRQVSSAIAFDALFLYPSADQTIGPCLASAGEFARAEVDFLIAHLSANGAVCDVGANIGTVSIPLAKASPGLSVFAFEPQLPIFRLLMRNVALNGVMSVEAYPWALGEADGMIEFASPALTTQTNFGAIGRGSQSGDKVPVVIRKLDSLALPPLSIIKIDVEGYDLEVVRGAQETIQRNRPILFCEAHASPKTVQLIGLLDQWGYEAYWFFAPFVSGSASQRSDRSAKIVGDTNIVAFPKGKEPHWPLPRIGHPEENWRSRVKEMHHLERYGCYP